MTLWLISALVLGCSSVPNKPAKAAKRAVKKVTEEVAGGGGSKKAPEGIRELSFDTPGGTRTAYLHVPKDYDASKPAPVIFSFHGGTGSPVGAKNFIPNWESQFDKGMLLVFPNGQSHDREGEAWASRSFDDRSDVDLTLQILDQVSKEYSVDPNRVYATGFSNGAVMTAMLACHEPERFAGFAMYSQTMHKHIADGCKKVNKNKAKPMLYVMGTKDKKWDGRDISMSAMETVDFWRDRLGCKPKVDKRKLPDGKDDDGTSVEKWVYDDCEKASAFEFLRIEGGGHSWPGPGLKDKDHRCTDIDGASEAVAFFREYAGM